MEDIMAMARCSMTSDELDQELAAAVQAYLADHPAAMDTPEGIAEWWLLRQRVQIEVSRVERVLRRQVEAGVLEAMGDGPSCRYRLRTRVS